MQGIHFLGQLQSPLFIRFYTHLHHMFVLVPRQLGFWPLTWRVTGPLRNIPAFHLPELPLPSLILSKLMLLTFLTSLPLFMPSILPGLSSQLCLLKLWFQNLSRSFSNSLPPWGHFISISFGSHLPLKLLAILITEDLAKTYGNSPYKPADMQASPLLNSLLIQRLKIPSKCSISPSYMNLPKRWWYFP